MASINYTWCAKNLNNSDLFSLSLRNSCQLPGMVVVAATRLRIPFPRFSLTIDFKLASQYTSLTMSILDAFLSCVLMKGRSVQNIPGHRLVSTG